MSTLRSLAKSFAVHILGTDARPHYILRGLAVGCQISVSPAENLSYIVGTAETHLQRVIRTYVSEGQSVFDVGANMGYVSLCLSKCVGPTGRVFAFEPVPANIGLLRKNIELNQLKNIRVFEVAASNSRGEATVRIAGNLSTASLIWHANDQSAAEITVKTEPVDEIVEKSGLPLPSFVKIDVEGAEGLVLTGMRRTITKARPVIFVECSQAGRETSWAMLRSLDYQCQSAITRSSIADFEQYRHSDFLWLPDK
jgi:FkbM family methyltransferase